MNYLKEVIMIYADFKKKFYNSKVWKDLRLFIINRDLPTCKRCGKLILDKQKLHVDHIIEINEKNYLDKTITLNPDNLQILCQKCHNHKTKIDKVVGSIKPIIGLDPERERW